MNDHLKTTWQQVVFPVTPSDFILSSAVLAVLIVQTIENGDFNRRIRRTLRKWKKFIYKLPEMMRLDQLWVFLLTLVYQLVNSIIFFRYGIPVNYVNSVRKVYKAYQERIRNAEKYNRKIDKNELKLEALEIIFMPWVVFLAYFGVSWSVDQIGVQLLKHSSWLKSWVLQLWFLCVSIQVTLISYSKSLYKIWSTVIQLFLRRKIFKIYSTMWYNILWPEIEHRSQNVQILAKLLRIKSKSVSVYEQEPKGRLQLGVTVQFQIGTSKPNSSELEADIDQIQDQSLKEPQEVIHHKPRKNGKIVYFSDFVKTLEKERDKNNTQASLDVPFKEINY